uniref:Uncharacterized protein n=1 Tax=Candidatus Kentrum sp. MB TaxID=2138164 RepID=A0A450XEB4_9GAMM|nr:MAG: hypothetical protein BECKMB1821G_GA0114241_100120 [Candidatus Kentron sp. MB]VFK27635.1 MAG: hypothetical protein BECKMB1821I_GA0114274_100420 [Candidatus Kentron sp. MB]VFK74372.1 MAG: hypothetical protein BECKMB1821H_GA0114242_100420 [Candidatus Kentron sp. MB]
MNRKWLGIFLFAVFVCFRLDVAAESTSLPEWLGPGKEPVAGAPLPPSPKARPKTIEEEIRYLNDFINDTDTFMARLAIFTEKKRTFYESVLEVKGLCQLDRDMANAQGEYGAIFRMGVEDCQESYVDLESDAKRLADYLEEANKRQKRLLIAVDSARDSILRKKSITRARALRDEAEKADELLKQIEKTLGSYRNNQ